MSEIETGTPQSVRPSRDHHPRIAGRRVTDLSAVLGATCWLALVAGVQIGSIALSTVVLYVALATLVLVPLGLGLVTPARDATAAPTAYTVAVGGQFPAALAAVAALATPQGSLVAMVLVVPWLAVTGTIALCGLQRFASRGGGPVPELAIDAACVYVPVAAAFLWLHTAGISLHFAPIIVLLTGVHFHYAGFVLPLVVGLTGRRLSVADGDDGGAFAANGTGGVASAAGRVETAITVVIVAGILLIAVGITVSTLVEAVAVALFATGVVGFAILVLVDVVPAVPRLPAVLLAVAALSLCWTMALALAFATSSLPGTPVLVTIPEMVRWHGSANAVGFALPSLLAFRLLERDRRV